MRKVLIGIAVAALAVPSTASAGGWATVGLSSLPKGVAPGEAWNVRITVLQHGETPLEGAHPSVTIRNVATGKEIRYEARATGTRGVYAARVVFPEAGTWAYEVYDGFEAYGGARAHTFAPVEIGAEPSPGTGGAEPLPGAALVPAILVALGLAGFGLLLWRARPSAAPSR